MNMADMFGKLTDFQKKMDDVKRQLSELEVVAEAGGGMVRVTANGNREITAIKIDRDIVDPEDVEMLEDLITAGINQALEKAGEAGQEKMAEVTRGILPGGMDLGNLGLR